MGEPECKQPPAQVAYTCEHDSSVDKQTNYGKHAENRVINTSGHRLPTTVLKFNRVERPEHPTQKPTDLLEWLIKTYTKAGETVLDCCMGSGSTGVATAACGRRFIGIELNPDYFKICQRRLSKPVEPPEPASQDTHDARVT